MFVFTLILFLFCLIFPQGNVDGAAAIVGDNIILHSDVLQQAQFVAIEKNINPATSPYLFEEIYLSTLNNVINQYAVLGVAEKDTNIVVSNDEVDRALDLQIENFIMRAGSEERFLQMAGTSMRQIRSEYWKDIRDMMVVERFQFSKIQNIDVGRLEVKSFYNAYKDSIPVVPEQFSFSVIEIPFVPGKLSEHKTIQFLLSLKNKVLENEASFDSLAKIYSHDSGTAQSGGFLGFTTRGSLVKEFEEVAYSLSPFEISDPIKTPFGYHIVRLIKRQGEKISTQHILRTISFSEEDKIVVFNSLVDILTLINSSSFVFDSLANFYSNEHKNFSGVYKDLPVSNVPDFILSALLSYESFPVLSSAFETEGGFAVIYFYDHRSEFLPSLDNSWNLIYTFAKQDKQNRVFNRWIDNIKKETYIKKLFN